MTYCVLCACPSDTGIHTWEPTPTHPVESGKGSQHMPQSAATTSLIIDLSFESCFGLYLCEA